MATLLAAHRAEFVAFAQARVKNPAHAEDIVQTAFTRATARADQLRDVETSAVAWFYRILRREIVDQRRRQGARGRAVAALALETPEIEPALEREARVCACVRRAAATLKPEYGEALARSVVDEIPVKDFAAEVGIQPNNAAVRVFRAREALKKKVESLCGACAEGGGCFDCTCAESAPAT
ncbi:MAG: sigma-70 family RNA polymerase sigma factor [Polyangiaceae bacterium]